MEGRTCTRCGETYPPTTEHFYRNKRSKFGLTSRCKECLKADQHKPDSDAPLPPITEQECKRCTRTRPIACFSAYTSYGRRYYRKTCMECLRFKYQAKLPKYKRRYHRKNKVRDNEYSREYYQQHREEILIQKKRRKLDRAQERLLP